MALKPDRDTQGQEDITYRMNVPLEQGYFVSVDTVGSGVAMDSEVHLAKAGVATVGTPALGCLMTSVRGDYDQTKHYGVSDSPLGGKVSILRRGWVVTNAVTGDPAKGQVAIMAASGTVTGIAQETYTPATHVKVGRFDTQKDSNGFARVSVDTI